MYIRPIKIDAQSLYPQKANTRKMSKSILPQSDHLHYLLAHISYINTCDFRHFTQLTTLNNYTTIHVH